LVQQKNKEKIKMENYRRDAQEALNRLSMKMDEIISCMESYDESADFWDVWAYAVEQLGLTGITDGTIIVYDEEYKYTVYGGFTTVTLDVGDFVRMLTEEELA
jgi:hypothetical protein